MTNIYFASIQECANCGGEGKARGCEITYIECRRCGMRTPFCSSPLSAVRIWNRRTPSRRQRLREALDRPDPVPSECDWWECRISDVADQQKTWCAENGWSCVACHHNMTR